MENVQRIQVESKKSLGKSISSKNTVAILIDMQDRFVSGLSSSERERIIPRQVAVLKYCKKNNIPVIVLELNTELFGKTMGILIQEVKKNARFYLVEKFYSDGFIASGLDRLIQQLGEIENILFMGVNADYCVKFTARSAISKGYKIITSNELISGQPNHSQDNSISWFRGNGICFDSMNIFSSIIERL